MPNAEDYAWFKSHGICPTCQKYPLAKHKSTCIQCSGVKLEAAVNKYLSLQGAEKQAEMQRRREYSKRSRELLKQQGICTMCGKHEAKQGRTLCAACNQKQKQRTLRCRMKKAESQGAEFVPRNMRTVLGLCYICGKPVSAESRNFCAECLEVQRRKASHMRVHITPESREYAKKWIDAFWREKKYKGAKHDKRG